MPLSPSDWQLMHQVRVKEHTKSLVAKVSRLQAVDQLPQGRRNTRGERRRARLERVAYADTVFATFCESARTERCVSVRWASSARRILSLWTSLVTIPCGPIVSAYISASVDHSSHVFTGSEVCFADDYFGWCSIAQSVEC
jgi:hypothetical protein